MAIVRLIHVNVDPSQIQEAERIWKDDCSPLMTRQKGCASEQLLKCMDSPV